MLKNFFKNRKTLKFKYLVIWSYGFLIYFFLRPYPSFQDGDVITNLNLYEIYRLFPIFIYLIIVVAIVLEFLKLFYKNRKSIFFLPILLPLLYMSFIFLSTPVGYQVIDFEDMFNMI